MILWATFSIIPCMSIEIARFAPPVPAREEVELVLRPLSEIERGVTIWEALPPDEYTLNDMLTVDNLGHELKLTVTPRGRGFIRFVPRTPQAGIYDTEFGAKRGGTILEIPIKNFMVPVFSPEIGRNGLYTGRELVHALIRYREGLPPPRNS